MVHHQPDQQSDSQLIADDEHSSRYQMFSSFVAYLILVEYVFGLCGNWKHGFFCSIHMNDGFPRVKMAGMTTRRQHVKL